MIKSNLWNGEINRGQILSSRFPYVVTLLVLLLGGGLGMLIPHFVNGNIEKPLQTLSLHLGEFIFIGLILAILIILRQDELSATIVIAISLCLDWYLGTWLVAEVIALVLLLIFFLARSPRYPWVKPQHLWLWVLFLGLTVSPAVRGALTAYDAIYYYPSLILGAFIMFWLGAVIARNLTSVHRFFRLVALFGTLIALHVIIEATTGTFLFATPNVKSFLASNAYFHLFEDPGVYRLATFFVQPDAGSAFLAMMLFIPLGLFVASSSFLAKILYLTETLLILIALLFTYSTGAWLAASVGMLVFLGLAGSMRSSVQILLCIIAAAVVLFVGFSSQVNLLFQHASEASDLSVRLGLWQTAWRVALAFPLTGIGLGRLAYLERAEPYLVPTAVSINNPHNSYLELGAMAGFPVLCVFLALLAFALWQALRHWTCTDGRTHSLLGAGIAAVIVLSFNSLSFGVWTFPPLAVPGWLILGVISSPLLSRELDHQKMEEKIP